MSDPDFNLLVALDILLSEASVAGAARRLNLSTSAMSRTLSRLRDVTGDPILVRAGRNMVLTPWAEATRDRARRAVHEARAVLQPSTETFCARSLARLFTIRANDGFVVAFGPALIAAVADAAPDVCIRFAPKPEKRRAIFGKGWLIWRLAFRVIWGQKYGCNDCLRIGLLASCVKGTRWLSRQK
jgi:DNA-binding transcriptional LysR family regulator